MVSASGVGCAFRPGVTRWRHGLSVCATHLLRLGAHPLCATRLRSVDPRVTRGGQDDAGAGYCSVSFRVWQQGACLLPPGGRLSGWQVLAVDFGQAFGSSHGARLPGCRVFRFGRGLPKVARERERLRRPRASGKRFLTIGVVECDLEGAWHRRAPSCWLPVFRRRLAARRGVSGLVGTGRRLAAITAPL